MMREIDLGMFKAYDIRTKSELLDASLIHRLMCAVGRYCRDVLLVRRVVIAHDARLSAPALMEEALQVFSAYGIDVWVNPLQSSTCNFYYSCSQRMDAAGMMITASHNPGNYIGMKLLAPGMQPIAMDCGPNGGLDAIRSFYKEGKEPVPGKRGKLHVVDEHEAFVDYSMRLAGVGKDSLGGLSVCAEFLSGVNGIDVAMAFDKAGADFTLRHAVPDGRFPAGDPNPIIESSIAPAREFIRNGSFDLGFCYDGDGDRMDLMDGKGEQVVPGFNMSVLSPYLLSLFHGAWKQGVFGADAWHPRFYADVKAIPTALIAIAKSGMDVHIIRNGHSFIKAKLKDNFRMQYLASEEESAHYYMNFPLDVDDWRKGTAATENTLFFTMLTSRAWMEHPEAFKEAIRSQRNLFREREWPLYFEKAPEEMEQIMGDVEEMMRKEGATIITKMDDGSDLDATLMRFGLPAVIDGNTSLKGAWCQVAQRISRSEDAMTRWEVASDSADMCRKMNDMIRGVAERYVAAGYAHF